MYERWEAYAAPGRVLRCLDGTELTVVSCGRRNTGAGPDFLDAVLLADGEVRVGSIEMHAGAEAWFAHGHHRDNAYRSVILHVVARVGGRSPRLPTFLLDQAAPFQKPPLETTVGGRVDAVVVARLSWQRLVRRAAGLIAEVGAPGGDQGWRRALLLRVFDALGYARYRAPMRRVAGQVCRWLEEHTAPPDFNALAVQVFSCAGVEPADVVRHGAPVVGLNRASVIANRITTSTPRGEGDEEGFWGRGVRPANHPVRRLWGGCALVHRLLHRDLERRLLEAARRSAWREMQELIRLKVGEQVVIGQERTRAIAVDAVLPWALAIGLSHRDTALVAGALTLYRTAPALGSNALVRSFERKHLAGGTLQGGFWQQGGIEWEQRHGSAHERRPLHLREPVVGYRPRRPHLCGHFPVAA